MGVLLNACRDMGADAQVMRGKTAKDLVSVMHAAGAGYAISREDEIATVLDVAMKTGAAMYSSGCCISSSMLLCSSVVNCTTDLPPPCTAITGVILDPVYGGKAIHAFLQEMHQNPGEWEGRKVLFVHTGGLLGMYDKVEQLQPLLEGLERSHRMVLG
jgi:D-cysteine desulfhydrase